ncbi:hypothetical protein ACWF94_41020, partial [Streptomyces sp. NPDC055078]
MPKHQSTAAQHARRRQRATGENYTTALRRTGCPVYVLARALEDSGLAAAAAGLTRLLAEEEAARPLMKAFERADSDVYNAPDDLPQAEHDRLQAASSRAWYAVEAVVGPDPYSGIRRELKGVFAALAHAGRNTDGQRLAQAAVHVLERHDGL